MSIKTVTIKMPEYLYEEVQKKLIDSGPCTNLSDAIYLALRCFLDEYFDDSNEPPIPDGMSKFAFYLEKLRKGIKEAGGLFPGKSSEEVIEILRQTRKEIYEERYEDWFTS